MRDHVLPTKSRIVCVVLVVLSFRQQSRLDQRIGALESALARARSDKGEGDPAKGGD